MNPLPEKIRRKILDTRLILAVVAANVLGTLFGFYYYLPQFSETSFNYWLLVADSPLATLLIATALLMHWRGKSSTLVETMAFIGNLKYGLWTAFVLVFYFESFWQLNSTPMYLFLLFSHLAMALQAYLVFDFTSFGWKRFLFGASWFVVNDFFDYYLQLHPFLPVELNYFWNPPSIVAVSLTFVGIILYYSLAEQERPLLADPLQRL